MKELASAVGSLVESLVDYSIVRGAQTIKLILEIRAKVWTACEALMGLIVGPLAAIDGFTSIELPGSYDHPSVA